MSSTIVVALGGNALQKKGEATAEAQERVAAETATQLVPLVRAGHKLVIVHGNGPQVGNIILHEEAINTPEVPTLPLDSAGAMSQGLIGYWLQQAIRNVFAREELNVPVVSLVTQTVVDASDTAFNDPSKPIGPFYETEEEARRIAAERNFVVKEDAGRGWRRVVPSPRPIQILEKDTVATLLEVGTVVIAAGGGGVPVLGKDEGYDGVEAVIDKDASAAVLAHELDAETLLILTSVPAAMVDFGTPRQRELMRVSAAEMKHYIDQGQFAPGSMLPKVQAAVHFAEGRPGRRAIITSPEKATEALEGMGGTLISHT